MVTQSSWKTESFNSFIGILYVIYSELDINFLEGTNSKEQLRVVFLYKNIATSAILSNTSIHTIAISNSLMCRMYLKTINCLLEMSLKVISSAGRSFGR